MAHPWDARDSAHGSAHDPYHSSPGTDSQHLPYDPYAMPAAPYRDDLHPSPQPTDSRLSGDVYRDSAASSSATNVALLPDGPGGAVYPPYRDSPLGSQPSLKPETPGAYGVVPAMHRGGAYDEKAYAGAPKKKKTGLFWALAIGALLLVAVAVVVPVYFTVIKKDDKPSGGASTGNSTTGGGSGATTAVTSGGDGSSVTTESGSTFTYSNSFGGFWVQDPENPWNNSARPNDWTPAIDQPWDWSKDKIYGVNLGGWFVLEPFITPALFQKYNGTVDEWSLSIAMRADEAGGGIDQIKQHYETFYTEEDIAQIAGAGINWVRIPIPFWAMDSWNDEPYLTGVSWPYILKALAWCRKYGLRVNLDLHTVPGSQNGNNHSGKFGRINWLNGPMGYANAQRSLDYIRTLAEFISQPEYKPLVPIFSIVNEAVLNNIGLDSVTSFYLEAHDMIRKITGVGEGAFLAIHDGFQPPSTWDGFLSGADRFTIDTHPYFAFGGSQSEPFVTGTGLAAGGDWPAKACRTWVPLVGNFTESFGVTIAGEFSNGWNDCGLFLLGTPNKGQRFPGDCSFWEDHEKWGQDTKDGLKNFAMASMDAMQNWFFWTWKIAPAQSGRVEIPLWAYKLGLDNGWMPTDPRSATGFCQTLSAASKPTFAGAFAPSQTGGGDGQVAATIRAEHPWPPRSLYGLDGLPMAAIPTYTPTGTMPPLVGPTVTGAEGSTSVFTGTATPAPKMAAVEGCAYPDPWTIGSTSTAVCTGTAVAALGGASATSTEPSTPTPAPVRRRW